MDNKLPRGISQRNGIIYLSFSVAGERYRESLGLKVSKPNIKHAVAKLQAIKYEVSIGSFNFVEHFPNSRRAKEIERKSGARLLVADLLNDWLRRMKDKCAYSTLKDYASAVNFHLIPRFGGLTVSEVTPSMVNDWLAELQISGKRKRNILIPFRKAMDDAMYEEIIDKNPLLRVKAPKHQFREPQPFTTDEVERILAEMEGVEKCFYWFAFETGLRTSELIALRWEDIDYDNGFAHISRACVRGMLKDTKTSSGKRAVPLTKNAVDCLNRIETEGISNDGFVFYDPKSKKRWRDDQFPRKRVWIPAITKSGVKYRNPYQTRHTYASRSLSRGENPLKVASFMGHSDWGMIRKVYGRWIK